MKCVNQHDLPSNNVTGQEAKTGNSKAYTCERLKREAPELFEQVVAGREDHPEWTQQRIADEVGVSRQYAHEVLSSKDCESQEKLDVPPHLNGDHEKADYRKLPMDMREAVEVFDVEHFPIPIITTTTRRNSDRIASPLTNEER